MNDQQDPLSQRVEQDAASLMPAFSESLHRRTMQQAEREMARRSLSAPPNRWLQPVLAMAAMLLLTVSIAWVLRTPQSAPARPLAGTRTAMAVHAPTAADLVQNGIEPWRELSARPIPVPHTLDDFGADASQVARYIANQFPTLPANAPKPTPDKGV